jgi:hypothetical protein
MSSSPTSRIRCRASEAGDVVDWFGGGERQAEPVVDCGADVAGLRADAWSWHQDLAAVVPSPEAFTQRVGTGRQFTVQEPAQRGAWTVNPGGQAHQVTALGNWRHQGAVES